MGGGREEVMIGGRSVSSGVFEVSARMTQHTTRPVILKGAG